MAKSGWSRRRIIATGVGAGATAVLVRAGFTGAVLPTLGPAFDPWRESESFKPGSYESLVAHAILAASPHNTQPWRFRRASSGLGLSADLSRHLGLFDPYVREMHIGLGAAIENLVIGASRERRIVRVRLDNHDLSAIKERTGAGPLIALDVTEGDTIPDSLAAQIPKRRTNRGPYRLDAEARHLLSEAAREATQDQAQARIVLVEDTLRARQFDDLVVEATERIIADKPMIADSDRWFRTQTEARQKRDGLSLDNVGLSPWLAPLAKMLPPIAPSSAHEFWLRTTKATLATTPVRGFVLVPALYDLSSCIAAGRAWQRFHLGCTARGLAVQPVNQPIEIVDREQTLGREPQMARRLGAIAEEMAWRPTFAFRAGFPAQAPGTSPRRGVKDVLEG